MELYQPHKARSAVPSLPLKESIRDMMRLQQDYRISDELFWEIFNARVLLNEQIDVNAFVQGMNSGSANA